MMTTGIKNATAEITKETLCRTPDFISAKISPNGKLIAQVGADEYGIANVTILSVDESLPSSKNHLPFLKPLKSFNFFGLLIVKKCYY